MLETARMRLLPWAGEDWPSLRPLARDPEVMRYISGGALWSDERIREFVERQIKSFAERQFCNWRLLHKESGEMIGFCGLQPWDDGQEI